MDLKNGHLVPEGSVLVLKWELIGSCMCAIFVHWLCTVEQSLQCLISKNTWHTYLFSSKMCLYTHVHNRSTIDTLHIIDLYIVHNRSYVHSRSVRCLHAAAPSYCCC